MTAEERKMQAKSDDVFFCSQEVLTDKVVSRRLSTERKSSLEEKAPTLEDKASEPQHSKGLLSPPRRQRSRTEGILEEDHGSNETRSKVENKPSSRVSSYSWALVSELWHGNWHCPSSSQKPLILRLPQSDSFSSLSDLMKRIQPRQSTAAAQSRGSKPAVSELSQSMMDLSVHKTETNNVPVPRLKPTVSVLQLLSVIEVNLSPLFCRKAWYSCQRAEQNAWICPSTHWLFHIPLNRLNCFDFLKTYSI